MAKVGRSMRVICIGLIGIVCIVILGLVNMLKAIGYGLAWLGYVGVIMLAKLMAI